MTETGFEPVKIRTDTPVDEERVVLFYIDDKPYDILKVVPPNISIKYMRNVLNKGGQYALAAAMEEVLGEKAMEALAECRTTNQEQMSQIMDLVERMLVAANEKTTGKSSGARRR